MRKILFLRLLSVFLVGCMTAILFVAPVSAVEENTPVSYGLSVFAAATDIAVMAPIGNEIVFSKDVIARGMNLANVQYITVKSLPAVTDGELLLGSTRVAVGQTIAGENLSYLSFSAAMDDVPLHSYFTLSVNGSATPVVCNLYLLDRGNCTPTVSVASGLSLNVSTYKGMSVYSTLEAHDPDGDALCFEIASCPANGSVRLIDPKLGTYVYTPKKGYVGADRFTYVARDQYGSYSVMATVNLNVNLSGTSLTYVDMKDHPAHVAALTLTEAGIMSGRQVGNAHYFYPGEGVSRVEFLVMAMNAVGIQDLPTCEKTVFADDEEIPDEMKRYVASAYSLGYIGGTDVDGKLCFLPQEKLTCAQAAVILNTIIKPQGSVIAPTFADADEIPAWAWEAICALNAVGILPDAGGYVTPSSVLTRADAAKMLAAAMAYREQNKNI